MKELKVIRTDIPDDPPSLDPQKATDMCSFRILNNVMEGLVRLNPEGEIVPGMAESWNIYDDGHSYEFILRDALWSNGTKVTAFDFEYAWKRNLNPNFNSRYAYLMFLIKNAREYCEGTLQDESLIGIKAISEKILLVNLVNPNPKFLDLITFPIYFPVNHKVCENLKDEFAINELHTSFNGPFIIDEWKLHDKLILKRNVKYYEEKIVNLDEVHYYVIKNASELVNAYKNNELDTIYRVPNQYLNSEFSLSTEIKFGPDCLTEYLAFNTQNNILSNKKIRKALSYSINRNELLAEAKNFGFLPAYGIVHPKIKGLVRENNGECFKDNLDFAKELFKEGIKEIGIEINKFRLIGENTTQGIKYMNKIKKWWKEIFNIELEVIPLGLKERIEELRLKKFDIAMVHWRADYNDSMSYLELFKQKGKLNYSQWENMEFNNLLDKAQQEENLIQKESILSDAEKLLMQEMPIAPLYYQVRPTLTKETVSNIVFSATGTDQGFKWANNQVIVTAN
ncbi:peptide ABC transporter substrate-binding protein [Bacillus cereus]|uniref:peptide ABC transporter substrate-binding protein n=1 Tax=Bacillus cereus TaxID=1396 RepID=UPI00062D5DC1|nr:peptide ABC transporter substrate-binding protein [Bacillus cereus]KLA35446.1 hypothetical protein B4080_3359 [Bacillus cereus]